MQKKTKKQNSVIKCLNECVSCNLYLKCLLGSCQYATYVDVQEVYKGSTKTIVTDCFLRHVNNEEENT
jgi:hypothetical protein